MNAVLELHLRLVRCIVNHVLDLALGEEEPFDYQGTTTPEDR